jgi:predicted enzyme related to lactoylglutathione lyase
VVPIDVVFTGIATSDLDAATSWYESIFGRPPDIVVNPDEVMWRATEGAWVYLIQDSDRAGNALVSIAVSDLDGTIAEIADRGKFSLPVETIEGAGRKARFIDPEGSSITFIEVLVPDD